MSDRIIIDDDLLDVVPARDYCPKHRGLTVVVDENGAEQVKEWIEDCDCPAPIKQDKDLL